MQPNPNLQPEPRKRSKAERPELTGDLFADAKQALVEHDGNVVDAINFLLTKIKTDEGYAELIVTQAVQMAVPQFTYQANAFKRRSVVEIHQAPSQKWRVGVLAGVVTSMWLDFPLHDGKRLRDATRNDIADQIEVYQRQIGNIPHKIQWLSLIAKKLDADKTVGETFSEQQLKAMWERSNV